MNYKKFNLRGFGFWGVESEELLTTGQKITIETRWGSEEERTICKKINATLYSLVPNGKSRDKKEGKKARIEKWAEASKSKSETAYEDSNRDSDFLSLAEPIKI